MFFICIQIPANALYHSFRQLACTVNSHTVLLNIGRPNKRKFCIMIPVAFCLINKSFHINSRIVEKQGNPHFQKLPRMISDIILIICFPDKIFDCIRAGCRAQICLRDLFQIYYLCQQVLLLFRNFSVIRNYCRNLLGRNRKGLDCIRLCHLKIRKYRSFINRSQHQHSCNRAECGISLLPERPDQKRDHSQKNI